jgi:hypothetical protein
MSRTSEHHQKTTNGVGKCSVPMWCGGLPSGFCDNDAYGEQTREYLSRFPRWNKYRQPAYAPGLACGAHGGPKEIQVRVFVDGTDEQGKPMHCAVFRDFVNLQESLAEFHTNPERAVSALKDHVVDRATVEPV